MMPGRNAYSTTNTTVAHDLVVAQKRKPTRNWEKNNPARRYLIPVEVRDEVTALAEALMENVDPVACVLFDYAETCHTRGTLKFKPRLNPTGRKHTLAWEESDTEPLQLQARRHRTVKRTDTPSRDKPLRIGWEPTGMPRSRPLPMHTTCAWRIF
jgi:hypothetical protein